MSLEVIDVSGLATIQDSGRIGWRRFGVPTSGPMDMFAFRAANPKSSPLELQATVPDYQIPFVPIIQEGESPFAMMVDLQKKYPWVLPTRSYDSIETLMAALKPGIIDPAVEMKNKLRLVKAQEQVTESLKDYLGKTL